LPSQLGHAEVVRLLVEREIFDSDTWMLERQP
jgi:hypothetical protein